jgi:hypothetical protein
MVRLAKEILERRPGLGALQFMHKEAAHESNVPVHF